MFLLKLFIILVVFISQLGIAKDVEKNLFDQQRPKNISDMKWQNLKATIQEVKLLPTPGDPGGFGLIIDVDGNRAIIGAPYGASKGAVFILDYNGQNWETSQIIHAMDGQGGDQFGFSVSLSGNRALIGAPFDDNNGNDSGSAYIFDLVDSTWSQTTKLASNNGTANHQFGYSVSLSNDSALIGTNLGNSAFVFELLENNWIKKIKLSIKNIAFDGFGRSVSLYENRALVGAPYDEDNGTGSGAVYVFDRLNSVWSQTNKLIAADGSVHDRFGYSVSLSNDKLLVGTGHGYSAYIFDYTNTNWIQTTKLTANNPEGNPVDLGQSVSLLDNKALVGTEDDASAYLFELSNGEWSLTAKLNTNNRIINGSKYFVGLSTNFSFIAAPGSYEQDIPNSIYVYELIGKTWTQTGQLSNGDYATNDRFGSSVSISGNKALIGGFKDGDNGYLSGSAYIFESINNIWTLMAKITAKDGSAFDSFGYSVNLSGEKAIIGAYYTDEKGEASGSAYIFELFEGQWIQSAKITAIDGASLDRFGWSVSISGNTALVGAFGDDDNGHDSGSAYVFELQGGKWEQTIKLLPNDGDAVDRFGFSVSLSGNRALIGAYLDDDDGTDSGSAYIYERTNGTWSQSAKLTIGIESESDLFGRSVNINGNKAIVGALTDDDLGADSGAAYVFETQDGVLWIKTKKLTAQDGKEGDRFGYSVSIYGDKALVSSHLNNENGIDSGAAYVFQLANGLWSQVDKLIGHDIVKEDEFGFSVSLYDDKALVGTPLDDDNGGNSGSAYIFNLNPPDLIYFDGFEASL